MKIRFLKKGIKTNGRYVPVWYSKGEYTKESGLPKGTITIYAKGYNDRLPNVLNPINQSDMQTDYFEKDKARITPTNRYYKKVIRVIK